ncbi:MAG TPA: glycosyl transferase family 4 [Clostridiales bacterium]|jgi:Fuc2NAc and GlcNAc transferase|nr:glycosyl transferase family 4 [Clostridiales bacterium]
MRGSYFVILAVGLLLLSYFLTNLVRKYAIEQSILDIPNERSSHSIVTPRGGGLAVAATFIFSLVFMAALEIVSVNVVIALVGGGLMIAAIGWIDDKNSVSPRLRLLVHFLAAFWALYCLDGFTQIDMGFTTIHLGWAGSVIAMVGIVWMINLYNFMDGIDGIAGTEAINVAFGAGVLLFWTGSAGLAWVCVILALAVGGFLVSNWPPARIFMGDVGSGFLGYVFAVLAIISEKSSSIPLIVWLMLLGVFITDATITLFRRMARGEKLSQPHRTHVYQLAVQAGYSHKQVTLVVLFINIMLGIAAVAAVQFRGYLLWIVLATFMLLTTVHFLLVHRFSSQLIADYEAGRSVFDNLDVASGQKEAAAVYETEGSGDSY